MRSVVRDVLDRWLSRTGPDGGAEPPTARAPGALPRGVGELRRRRPGDIGPCVRLLNVVHLEDGYPVRWPESPRGWLDGPDVLDAFVVDRLREIVGHVATVRVGGDAHSALRWRELTGLRSDEVGAVSRLYVRRRARGHGIGGALLDTAAAEVRRRGLTPVLDVVTAGTGSLALLERHGWRPLASYPWGEPEQGLHIHYLRGPE